MPMPQRSAIELGVRRHLRFGIEISAIKLCRACGAKRFKRGIQVAERNRVHSCSVRQGEFEVSDLSTSQLSCEEFSLMIWDQANRSRTLELYLGPSIDLQRSGRDGAASVLTAIASGVNPNT